MARGLLDTATMVLHRTCLLNALQVLSWFVSSVALAQPGAAATAEQASAETTPTSVAPSGVAPEAPKAPSLLPDASAVKPGSETKRCRLGAHAGIDENDAETAASLVCREIETTASHSKLTYRVDLDKLGSVIFVTLTSESGTQSLDARRAKLDKIEDVAIAAPHLATALTQSKSLKETEKVGNLTTADAAAPIRKYGQFQFGAGVLAGFAPGINSISPGIQAALRYDTPTWVLSSQLRLGWDTGDYKGMNFFQIGVGPAYMLSLEDTSLFVGGGMAILGITHKTLDAGAMGSSYGNSYSNSGVGVYAEVGVEMMRLHRNRLNASLRADLPAFTVNGDYLVPLSLTTSFVFD